jgi:hypothetical protein
MRSYEDERPNFNLATMSANFRRFNARIGVVFKFQKRMIRLLSWSKPSQTLSFLAVYSFVCLDPYLLCVLPPVAVLLAVLVPSFMARHPLGPTTSSSSTAAKSASASASTTDRYSPRGPPLAPARTVKPVKELSRDFFRNMRDLQNSMDDFSMMHDQVVALVVPRTNFSDEALSSAVFSLLCAVALAASISAHLLPWRLIFLVTGWVGVCSGHPWVARLMQSATPAELRDQAAKDRLAGLARSWVDSDIILDSAPETREVEIFELQRLVGAAPGGTPGSGGEWEPWLFSPSPHDPLSAARIAGSRPSGTRFFEDVLPPDGWEWSEKKWALDLWSREWVEERIITGVEVETEGERWVYDMYNENEVTAGVIEQPSDKGAPAPAPTGLSWEEGEEGMGRRGEWRRRRWVRMVKRRNVSATI